MHALTYTLIYGLIHIKFYKKAKISQIFNAGQKQIFVVLNTKQRTT